MGEVVNLPVKLILNEKETGLILRCECGATEEASLVDDEEELSIAVVLIVNHALDQHGEYLS